MSLSSVTKVMLYGRRKNAVSEENHKESKGWGEHIRIEHNRIDYYDINHKYY